jgi:head-tail adaptor
MWRPAGRLKNPVAVESLNETRQANTSTSRNWLPMIDPYFVSEYVKVSAGTETVNEMGSFNDQRYMVFGYYDPRITDKCRLVDGTTTYNIVGLDNGDEDSEMMQITVIRGESREA